MDSDVLYHMLEPNKQLLPNDSERKRLFHPTQASVDIFSICPERQKYMVTNVVGETNLENCSLPVERSRICFFVLRQRDSWSRIQITFQGFVTMIRQLNIFSSIWTFVQGFGLKFESTDEYHIGYKSQFHGIMTSKQLFQRLEICYTIRYFEKHKRPNTKAIWSERQTAIYHSFNIKNMTSFWVLIQPSASMESSIRKFLSWSEGNEISPTDHLKAHVAFFLQLADNWRAYINFLEVQLSEIDEKALHSKVATTQTSDYAVTFKDTQTLEIIRRKLLKASLILKSSADVGKSWMKDTTKLERQEAELNCGDFLELMSQYVTELERHTRIVESLLNRLGGTSKLLFQLLDFRNDETKIRTSLDIQNNGHQLRTLAQNSMATNDTMTAMTLDIHSDSKFLKVLTFITVLYTPASLVATIFSSNLVQSVTQNSAYDPTHFVLSGDFWKFPVFTICLLVITITLAFGLRRIWPILFKRVVNLGDLSKII